MVELKIGACGARSEGKLPGCGCPANRRRPAGGDNTDKREEEECLSNEVCSVLSKETPIKRLSKREEGCIL